MTIIQEHATHAASVTVRKVWATGAEYWRVEVTRTDIGETVARNYLAHDRNAQPQGYTSVEAATDLLGIVLLGGE